MYSKKSSINLAPDVTVVMSCHNESKHIDLAISSILHQTFSNFSFVIIDDGSTDNTFAKIKYWANKDQRITYAQCDIGNLGGVLEKYCKTIESEFIARMDGDDVSEPNRLASQIRHMRDNHEIVVCSTNYRQVTDTGMPFSRSKQQLHHSGIYAELLRGRGGAMCHAFAMIRTTAYVQVGGYSHLYPKGEDLDLFLRLSEVGKLSNISKTCGDVRRHSESSTFASVASEGLARRREIISAHQKRIGASIDVSLVQPFESPDINDWPANVAFQALRYGYINTLMSLSSKNWSNRHYWTKILSLLVRSLREKWTDSKMLSPAESLPAVTFAKNRNVTGKL